MRDLSELNYFAIRTIVRGIDAFPIIVGILTLLGGYLLFGAAKGAVVLSLVLAGFGWFMTRLFVEIVAVVADTLLPR